MNVMCGASDETPKNQADEMRKLPFVWLIDGRHTEEEKKIIGNSLENAFIER